MYVMYFLTYAFTLKSAYLFNTGLLNKSVISAVLMLLNVRMNGFGSINWWGFSPAIDFWSYLSLNDAVKTDVNGFSGNCSVSRSVGMRNVLWLLEVQLFSTGRPFCSEHQ